MTYTYSPNIPQPGDFPSQSQDQILQNYQYLNVFGARDHYMPANSGTANTGSHKQVTLSNIAAPGFAGGNSVLFANTDGTNSQLFFQNAAGTVQLTGLTSAYDVGNTRGTTFLPGNLILNYGTATVGANATVVITFATPFNAVPAYSITIGSSFAGAVPAIPGGQIIASTTTSFTYRNMANNIPQLNYMAIGPA